MPHALTQLGLLAASARGCLECQLVALRRLPQHFGACMTAQPSCSDAMTLARLSTPSHVSPRFESQLPEPDLTLHSMHSSSAPKLQTLTLLRIVPVASRSKLLKGHLQSPRRERGPGGELPISCLCWQLKGAGLWLARFGPRHLKGRVSSEAICPVGCYAAAAAGSHLHSICRGMQVTGGWCEALAACDHWGL